MHDALGFTQDQGSLTSAHSAQVSVLYWMRHNETKELLPLFMKVDDMSVLPLCTMSSAPPAHCVPANLTMAMEFQPELHCRIAELRQSPAESHAGPAVSDLMTAMDVTDSDLKVGLGLTVQTPSDLVTQSVLVYQRSSSTPLSSSPLAPRMSFPLSSGKAPRRRAKSAEL